MRLALYAGGSTALAAAVVLSAFHQRSNFYSAMVHLSQSNFSILVLINLLLLVYTTFVYGLQRLCFGQLRPVEIEQLYEKAWFAVTETCLAMTIFREEVGAFFIVMFTALLTGKVWGWIGDGRVEILEQQPPANPRLFHTRLSISLVLSILYDLWMLHYATRTVIQQARPNMMVMFLFEFGILLVCSAQTALRYIVSLTEQSIVKSQTRQGLEARRRQVRERRADIERRRESGEATEDEINDPLPDENDIEEMDIEVPGWEAKGHWILFLDLWADFLKLAIYTAFFVVLLTFYGLPIHIMRDLFMTTRSFIKRLGALLRYRQAIKDLNRYPDAVEEDLSRENTCIICREEMHPWQPNNVAQVERSRPKKLPCGHILHFGCLKSWLERQQVCPTCRRSVVIGAPEAGGLARAGGGLAPNANAAAAPAANPGAAENVNQAPGAQQPQPPPARPGVRMFNLGPIRLGFAQGGPQELQDMAQMFGVPADVAQNVANNHPALAGAGPAPQPQIAQHDGAAVLAPRPFSAEAAFAQLRAIEGRIQQETLSLRIAEEEAQILRLLLEQLEVIRLGQSRSHDTVQALQAQQPPAASGSGGGAANPGHPSSPLTSTLPPSAPSQSQPHPQPSSSSQPTAAAATQPSPPTSSTTHIPPPSLNHLFPQHRGSSITRHVAAANASAIPAGSPDLPEGVTLPPGWSLLPLQRADIASSSAPAPDSSSPSSSTSTAGPGSNQVSTVVPSEAAEGAAPVGRQVSPPVSAATSVPPLAPPAWGGSAQLFGSSVGSRSSSNSGDAPASGPSSTTRPPPQNGSSSTKGKAKAATVEEGDNDSDEWESDEEE